MNSIGQSLALAGSLIYSGNAQLLEIVGRSLWVSAIATALGCLGHRDWLTPGTSRFGARGAVIVCLKTFVGLPSVIAGVAVYLLLSRSGPFGGLGWLFSVKAMILAQMVLVFPLSAALACRAVEQVQREWDEQLQSIGAGAALRAVIFGWELRSSLLLVCSHFLAAPCRRWAPC